MIPSSTPVLRRLGSSELMLSPLGLGCWQFSNNKGLVGKFWPALEPESVEKIVRISLEGGINWFDTAEIYGGGQSEEILSRTLASIATREAQDARIATKWWPILRTARHLSSSIDKRINALGGRDIHLYQVHQPYSLSSVASEMGAMASLVKKGKIQQVGVSNFSAKAMREADRVLREHGLRLISNQVKYSLLDRRIEDNGILDTAKELGIAIIAYSPLEQGILSGKFHRHPELIPSLSGPRKWSRALKPEGLKRTQPLISALEELAIRYEASPTQIALNWLISYSGDTVFAIPGATKPHHAEENVKAMRFTLTEAELNDLDTLSRQVTAKR